MSSFFAKQTNGETIYDNSASKRLESRTALTRLELRMQSFVNVDEEADCNKDDQDTPYNSASKRLDSRTSLTSTDGGLQSETKLQMQSLVNVYDEADCNEDDLDKTSDGENRHKPLKNRSNRNSNETMLDKYRLFIKDNSWFISLMCLNLLVLYLLVGFSIRGMIVNATTTEETATATAENVDEKINNITAQTDERFSGMARLVADQAQQMSEIMISMDELNNKTTARTDEHFSGMARLVAEMDERNKITVNDLKSRCSKQEEELSEMKSVKTQDMARLNGRNSDQAKEINSLRSSAQSNTQEMMKEIKSLKELNSNQLEKVNTLTSLSRNFIDKTKCKAAVVFFSAGLNIDTTITAGHTIIYNRIMATSGDGYNSSTGVFTCQVPGMYTFNVEALAQNSQQVDLTINHNTNHVARLYVHPQGYNSGSTSAMMMLNKGDTVQVKSQGTSRLHDASYGPHNTFSGVRTPDLLQDCA